VQSLLAVGNAHGLVRVYGQTDLEVGVPSTGAVTKFDVERPLQLPGHFCVQQMVFDTNQVKNKWRGWWLCAQFGREGTTRVRGRPQQDHRV